MIVSFCSFDKDFLELLIVDRVRVFETVEKLRWSFNNHFLEIDPLKVVVNFLDVAVFDDILDDEGVDTPVVPEVI